MRFGTILYRKGADILVSFSWALSVQSSSQDSMGEEHTCAHATNLTDKETVLHNAACIVNDLIHEEMERQSAMRSQYYTNPLSFSIDNEFKYINQLLLEFIDSITATVRERKHPTLRKESEASKHLKKVRMYNILSLLQICANPTQPLVLHDLLADVVEVCGGSRQLLRILNRIGCSSSPDSHDRFVAQHADEERKRCLWDELSPTAFTVVSVDNFDMLQSHSAVYCGNQHRSYHGTTVQVVQPNPNNEIHHGNGEQTLPTSTLPFADGFLGEQLHVGNPQDTVSKRILQQSPDRSPHKIGKIGPKRQRTVAVRNLTSSLFCDTDSITSEKNSRSLTMTDFEESNEETSERVSLSSKLFSYILLKYIVHHYQDFDCILSDMRCFLDDKCNEKIPPSQIHYMELINENPDSDETMCIVAEDLLEKFDTKEQMDGW